MTKKDFRILNVVFRAIILLALFTGIRLAANFFTMMENYESLDGNALFGYVSSMAESYMFFVVLMVAALVFSILLRKGDKKNCFIFRTMSIAVAMAAAFMSFPVIAQLAYIGLAKLPEELAGIAFRLTLEEVYSLNLNSFLIDRPYLFYTYMISIVIFLGLTITSVISMINQHKDRKNDNNQFKRY